MTRRQMNPAELKGDQLANWYVRSPEEIDEERRAREEEEYQAFFGPLRLDDPERLSGSWQEARSAQPRAKTADVPLRTPNPVRDRARGGAPVNGTPATSGEPGAFFATSPIVGGDYFNPDLPPPLNRVQPSVKRGSYVLSDGRIVSADEVERIYAEQGRRARGDDVAPSPYARAVDRLPDGQIPLASQLEKSKWERDPTCHPYGGWQIDPGYRYYPKASQDYEFQVTGARGVDYVVRPPGKKAVKFDGCAVASPDRHLQEAKGPGYDGLLTRGFRSIFGDWIMDGLAGQARRQREVAGDRRVVWSVAEKPVVERFGADGKRRFNAVDVRHVPARP